MPERSSQQNKAVNGIVWCSFENLGALPILSFVLAEPILGGKEYLS